ncbi:phage baseplate upper protein [Bacillus wiedmannii]|uniref:phage baseplate upper protein n=1 Tax=Bacillus wiedmannii TaxID=1890302 RepID=UPI0021D3A3DE|nr:phage baseplate upper protein [Bacillus wiedmannii]MCU5706155.1 phage baseplate upper protein [Bacillus wiedmannii]
MRTETLVLDLSNQSMPRTITARENDRNGFKVIGNLRERGKSVDLTGFAVFYEAISPLGMFVRDIAVITNFRDGVFEYIVSKEAVSSSGVWIGYFAFEKGTERFTTQDIRISLGVDVKSGSIQLENYIAEFDTIKKQVDALQIAVDNANVVKRSGGTMTGNIDSDISVGSKSKGYRWRDSAGALFGIETSTTGELILYDYKSAARVWQYDPVAKRFTFLQDTNLVKKTGDTMTGPLKMDRVIENSSSYINYVTGTTSNYLVGLSASGRYHLYDDVNKITPFEYNPAAKTFNVNSDTNLLKKTGDTMTGVFYLRNNWEHTISDGSKGVTVVVNDPVNKWAIGPKVSGITNWANELSMDLTTGTVTVADLKTKKDTDWIPLTLLNGVKQQSSQPASAVKRSGNVVNIVCAITDFKDKQVIANVPAIFRPDREMLFTPNYFQGLALKTGYVIVKPNGDIYLEGIEATVSLYRFSLTYIV